MRLVGTTGTAHYLQGTLDKQSYLNLALISVIFEPLVLLPSTYSIKTANFDPAVGGPYATYQPGTTP
jgi:hypothetical protein